MFDWLIDFRLNVELTDWFLDLLFHWLIDCSIVRLIEWSIDWLIDFFPIFSGVPVTYHDWRKIKRRSPWSEAFRSHRLDVLRTSSGRHRKRRLWLPDVHIGLCAQRKDAPSRWCRESGRHSDASRNREAVSVFIRVILCILERFTWRVPLMFSKFSLMNIPSSTLKFERHKGPLMFPWNSIQFKSFLFSLKAPTNGSHHASAAAGRLFRLRQGLSGKDHFPVPSRHGSLELPQDPPFLRAPGIPSDRHGPPRTGPEARVPPSFSIETVLSFVPSEIFFFKFSSSKSNFDPLPYRDAVESDLTFIGLLIMRNNLKLESADVIAELQASAIQTVMVTGENSSHTTPLMSLESTDVFLGSIDVFLGSTDVFLGSIDVLYTTTDHP